jgi:phosphoribosylaminoimidazole-succinocarboxamide synthase
LKLYRQGKVRDVYDLGNRLLLVASDRISAFDYVLPTLIPEKGKILTQMSAFWFKKVEPVIAHHLISVDAKQFPQELSDAARAELDGRTMLVQKTDKLDVECIVRGYLAGSGWKEYQKSQSICGIPLPKGLQESERLPEPIFTPTTKAEGGAHDENMTFDEMAALIGRPLANTLRQKSLEIYNVGHA